jgi:hypothetical protein
MKPEKLLIRIKKGSAISESEMKEMYAVRSHFMDIKPTVPREKDFAFFSRLVRTAGKVFLFTTKEGSIKGLYIVAQHLEKSRVNGKERLVIEPEFGFIYEEYQGKYMAKTTFGNMVRTLTRHPFKPKYLLGPAYPVGYLTLKKHGAKVWSWLDKDVPDDVKDVLFLYAERNALLENGRFNGIKNMYTLPRKTGKKDLERLEKNPAYHYYASLNPNWQEGYGLVALTKIDRGTIWHMVKNKIFNR